MKKSYLFICFLFICLGATSFGYSQSNITSNVNDDQVKGLSIYPNPVTNGKVNITSTNNLVKDVEIFDVLGKKVFTTTLLGKELNISKLTSGIYVIKIKENGVTATRKLVVR
jgi:hypothetical protein